MDSHHPNDDDLTLPSSRDEETPPAPAPALAYDATPYELAAESPPAPPPVRHPLPPPDPGGLTYGVRKQVPPPLPSQVGQCPKCRVAMPASAVLCVVCGHHRDPRSGDISSPPSLAGARTHAMRWCAACGGEIPPEVIHCPRCNMTVSQKLGERAPSVAANCIAELAIPVAAVLATLMVTPAAVAWAEGLGGPLLAMVLLVTLINASLGAAVVRVACWVTGEDVPDWPRAAAMCFLAGIVSGGCNLSLHYLPIQGFGGVLGALILMFAAPGILFYLLLDVTFWKGVLIYAVYFLILLVFLLLLGAMLGVAAMTW